MSEMTREEQVEIERSQHEFLTDLDSLTPQEHMWVDRGAVLSCEGASHPTHRAFKRGRTAYKVSESSEVL